MCKLSEGVTVVRDQVALPKKLPVIDAMLTPGALIQKLKTLGWTPLKPRQTMYRAILTSRNLTETANIFVHGQGIYIQLKPNDSNENPKPFSLYQGSLTEGRVVKHYLAHTAFNLYHGILRFADSFRRNETDLDRYFRPVGCSDKRTPEMKALAASSRASAYNSTRSEMEDIYDACSDGSGEDAYLGDGMWITSAGGLYER